MPSKRSRKRVRGSDGKLYDPKKQSDNGHRAHENRAETAARRARWRSRGAAGRTAGGVSALVSRFIGGFIWLLMMAIVRPARAVCRFGVAVVRGLAGWLAGCIGRLTGRTSNNRRRGRRGRD